MGVYIPNMDMPKNCYHCPAHDHWDTGIKCVILNRLTEDRPSDCPLIEIDLERDIPTIWYNRQTGQYEPKDTKQEVYERLYKLKNERRADEHNTERD